MSVLENLKTDRALLEEAIAARKAQIDLHTDALDAHERDLADLDKAIAALSTETEGGLLDHQPEAASPEFASEQSVPVQIVHEERWPYSVSYTIAESGFGSGAYEHLYEARDDYEAFKLEPKYLTVVLKHRGKVIDTFARPIGADVPEDERDETWVPPPGYTYIPTQGERCVCVNLMQDGIGNFFCCNQRGETSADAERIEDVSQAELTTEQEHLPSGIKFYVDGGPLQTTGQEPAAFAPVNAIEEPDTDALMWANGFEADAKSKAEPEQDKRPFWMFGKKELA